MSNRFLIAMNRIFCLLVIMLFGLRSSAQSVFNRTYTLHAYTSQFQAVATHGTQGGFMAMALSYDSTAKMGGISIIRYDAEGKEEAANFFLLPDGSRRDMKGNIKCLTRINDNAYVALGCVTDWGKRYGFIVKVDSNGKVVRYRDIIVPYPAAPDTITYTNVVRYDGNGYLLVAGEVQHPDKLTADYLLLKYDTSLNLIWQQLYHPADMLSMASTLDLIIENDGYTLCGGTQNSIHIADTFYREQVTLIKTDTTGMLQWHYASPKDYLEQCQSRIISAIQTSDGGYLYLSSGQAYNRSSSTKVNLYGKIILTKLDASRNKIWIKEVDNYYTNYGLRYMKLLKPDDSNFILIGSPYIDSAAPSKVSGAFMMMCYRQDGSLVYRQELRAPKDASDTSSLYRQFGYDITQTADKGFVVAGFYINPLNKEPLPIPAPSPTSKAWLVKVDSNGCVVPDCKLGILDKPISIVQEPFVVYPNPSSGLIHIRPLFSPAKIMSRTYDLAGRCLTEKEISFHGREAVLETGLAAGMYILELSDRSTGILHRQKLQVR